MPSERSARTGPRLRWHDPPRVTEREADSDVPFAGLRRHARALAAGVALLPGLLLPGLLLLGLFAVFGLIGRRIPFFGEGTGVRHAPGWD